MSSLSHQFGLQFFPTLFPQIPPLTMLNRLYSVLLRESHSPHSLLFRVFAIAIHFHWHRIWGKIYSSLHTVPSMVQQHTYHLELVRNVEAEPSPDLVNQNLHFNKIPRGFNCTLKFERHFSIALSRLPAASKFSGISSSSEELLKADRLLASADQEPSRSLDETSPVSTLMFPTLKQDVGFPGDGKQLQ